jgi:hypothetical protein
MSKFCDLPQASQGPVAEPRAHCFEGAEGLHSSYAVACSRTGSRAGACPVKCISTCGRRRKMWHGENSIVSGFTTFALVLARCNPQCKSFCAHAMHAQLTIFTSKRTRIEHTQLKAQAHKRAHDRRDQMGKHCRLHVICTCYDELQLGCTALGGVAGD